MSWFLGYAVGLAAATWLDPGAGFTEMIAALLLAVVVATNTRWNRAP